jgi:hypothetical protein
VALKYLRFWAVAIAVGLMSMAGPGAVLAADDVVFDGTVTVHWVDATDGPMAGASITVSWYHDPADATYGIVPGRFTTDAAGDAVVTGVPRAAGGAEPLLLDVRGDLTTATVDDAGCVTYADWLAETKGVASELVVDVILVADTKSINVNCPEPTPTPDSVDPTPTPNVVDPTPTPAPTATSAVVDPTPAPTDPPSGGVLGTTGTPAITPPNTDAVAGPSVPAGSPFAPILLAILAFAVLLVPATSLAFARAQRRPRRGPRNNPFDSRR